MSNGFRHDMTAEVGRSARQVRDFYAPRNARGTYALVVVLLVVFLLENLVWRRLGPGAVIELFRLDPGWPARPWTLITNVLSHDVRDWGHIAFNAIMILAVAPWVEKQAGARVMLLVFLVCGIVASVVQETVRAQGTLGASGGATALMGWASAMVLTTRSFAVPPRISMAQFTWRSTLVAGTLCGAWLSIRGLAAPSRIGDVAHLTGIILGAVGALVVWFWDRGGPKARPAS